MPELPTYIDEHNIEEFLENIDNVMVDCDGVLWCMEEVIEDADHVLNKLRKLGKRVFFVTNNSTKSRKDLAAKCKKLGFLVEDGETLSPGLVIAEHLKNLNFNKKIYLIGSEGLANELDLLSLQHTGLGPDPIPENIYDLATEFKPDPEIGAVVVGFDPHFNLSKILKAASYLQNPDCLFLASNKDERFPLKNGNLIFPGTGVIVNAVEMAADRKALSCGKPSPQMFEALKRKFNLNPSRTIMIGDRCDTDILLGKNCGLMTLVVLSGINSWEDIKSYAASLDPEKHKLLADYYLPYLGAMNSLLPRII